MTKFQLLAAAAVATLLTAGQASAASILDVKTLQLSQSSGSSISDSDFAALRAQTVANGVSSTIDILPTDFGAAVANWTATLFTGTLNVAVDGSYKFDFIPTVPTIGGYISIDNTLFSKVVINTNGSGSSGSGGSLTAGAHTFEAFVVKKGGNASAFTGKASGANAASLRFSPLTTAVPEPATWAMMLVGFAMVGAASRYRRRAATVTFA
ncbi:hypothetical protein GCM10011380_30750 [Sphingomonas metalli]|uniref:Ice-binding protein C-terminal domain-containing protein n=1 Tax=Sphingomonas metalli TaxID=1779358 RepID=A0A916TCR6_9SPHN|nr:PEPxxWA-CTERM sorting domain-containing protein [Sphingomonas metalli]GGB39126.1 hypothetical protein GCM10011380_30750 [Sphingomonas metalli]